MSGPDQAARARLAETLERHDCAALIVLAASSSDPDLAPFTGAARLGESCLLAIRGGDVVLGYFTPMERDEARATGLEAVLPQDLGLHPPAADGDVGPSFGRRAGELVGRLLQSRGPQTGRIALAGRAFAGDVLELAQSLEGAGFEVTNGTGVSRQWRRAKTDWQMDDVRRTAAVTCVAMRRVAAVLAGAAIDAAGRLRQGERDLRIGDLLREIAFAFADAGLEQPEGQIVSAGAVAGVPHSRGNPETVLRAGETIIVDLFPRSLLFADCTRTFVVGPATEEIQRPAALVREALEQAERGLRAGVAGRSLQEAACALFESAGYPTLRSEPGTTRGYVHGLGHGVGFELHELPSFRSTGEDGQLRLGDVVTIEPGLYDPAAGYGIRLEDLLWLGPDGRENLTPLPYDLDPSAWPQENDG